MGKAAIHQPALAILSHTPPGATETICWVGKGIVYDTGGLSIKGKVCVDVMVRCVLICVCVRMYVCMCCVYICMCVHVRGLICVVKKVGGCIFSEENFIMVISDLL